MFITMTTTTCVSLASFCLGLLGRPNLTCDAAASSTRRPARTTSRFTLFARTLWPPVSESQILRFNLAYDRISFIADTTPHSRTNVIACASDRHTQKDTHTTRCERSRRRRLRRPANGISFSTKTTLLRFGFITLSLWPQQNKLRHSIIKLLSTSLIRNQSLTRLAHNFPVEHSYILELIFENLSAFDEQLFLVTSSTMSDLSSIVSKGCRFADVQLFVMSERQFANKQFVPLNNNIRPYTLVSIDQAENLLLRFIDQPFDGSQSLTRTATTQSHQHEHQQFHNNNNSFNGDQYDNQQPFNNTLFNNVNNQDQNGNNGNINNHLSVQHLHIGNERIIFESTLYRESDCFPFVNNTFVISNCESKQQSIVMIQFRNKLDLDRFTRLNQDFRKQQQLSMFNQRTDAASASQYFQFYGYLSQQQNMMQDYVRTSTYQKAIHSNSDDFHDKVVLDVGAGSGILSFFALQAGARKVYAVEASSMAKHAQLLVQSNNLGGRIEVIAGKIEEIELPEPVDIIISEPMGYMLFNERMLETYLHAKKWLRTPNEGRMFPSRGDLHVAPFTDAQLYIEQTSKANFWYSKDFHGVDLRALHSAATNEYFKQPIVDTFDIRICMAKTVKHTIDFQKAHETDLHCISIPLEFLANQTGHIHGLAFWFDVAFIGSAQTVWLSTAPSQPLTHWYQVRCLLSTPLFVNKGQQINGSCVLRANKRQSYDVDIELFIKGLGTHSSNTLDLKNPYFRYTGQPVPQPPGANDQSPSEQMWSNAAVFDPYNQQNNQMMAASNPVAVAAAAVANQALNMNQAMPTLQQIVPNQ